MVNGNVPAHKPIEVTLLSDRKADLEVLFWRKNLVAAPKRCSHTVPRPPTRAHDPAYPNQIIAPNLSYITLTSKYSRPDPVGDPVFAEVLVSAHDDGEGCVWYTRDRIKLPFRLPLRLMAVSAGDHSIQVFELAITDDGNCPSPEEGRDAGVTHRHRRRSKRKHGSFGCGGGGGFEGIWLVSTSIDEIKILRDATPARPMEKCRLGMDNRGWSVLFLKPLALKPSWGAVSEISLSAIPVKTIPAGYYDPNHYSDGQLMEEEDEDGVWSEEIFFGPSGANAELVTPGFASRSSHHASNTTTCSDNRSGHYSYQCSDTIHNPRSPLNNLEEETPSTPHTSVIFSTSGRNSHPLTVASSLSPIVRCSSPLRACRPRSPSLVIAASQKGRVALFSLIRVGHESCIQLDDILPRKSEHSALGGRRRFIEGRKVGSSVHRGRGGRRINERPWRHSPLCVFVDGRGLSYVIGPEGSPERAWKVGRGGIGAGMGAGRLVGSRAHGAGECYGKVWSGLAWSQQSRHVR
ncbi:hypothetical protein HOY80DRAFT_1098724 [Tuber brumale]|nr:hypothetical protein HOY80DRAFT_1098724 [Tuber brumale]